MKNGTSVTALYRNRYINFESSILLFVFESGARRVRQIDVSRNAAYQGGRITIYVRFMTQFCIKAG